jgi:hypothetical protein
MIKQRELIEVLKFCEPKDLLTSCSLVCINWQQLSQSDEVWYQAIEDTGTPIGSVEKTAKNYYKTHCIPMYPILTAQKLYFFSLSDRKISEHQLQPTVEIDHTSAWVLLPGKFVMCAGSEHSAKAYLIEPINYSTQVLPDMLQVRGWFAMLYYLENVYVFGGFYSPWLFTKRCERFERSTGQWKQLPDMSAVRSSFNACRWKEIVFVAGGWQNPEVEYMNLQTEVFQTLDIRMTPTCRTLCWVVGDQLMIIQDQLIIWWDIVNSRQTSTEPVQDKPRSYIWTNTPPMEYKGKLFFLVWEDGKGYSMDLRTRSVKQVIPNLFSSLYP